MLTILQLIKCGFSVIYLMLFKNLWTVVVVMRISDDGVFIVVVVVEVVIEWRGGVW